MARLNQQREDKILTFIKEHMEIADSGQLRWVKDHRVNKCKDPIVGQQVGNFHVVSGFKYLLISVPSTLLGVPSTIMVNRCAWALHTGKFPKGSVVNINGNLRDFSKENLGEYDPRVNHVIARIQKCIDEEKYTINKVGEYFVARYWDDPSDIHSGQSKHKFDTYENAMNARIRASEERIKVLKSTIKTLV